MAAKKRPFSMARKAMTCGTALERVIIIRKDIRTQASAMPSVPLASADDRCEIGMARLNEKITTPMPMSMVVGMLIRVSTSQRMPRRSITRCSSQGISSTLSRKVRPADRYR
ncbi:hypothetical protein D9M68_891560 [compost metagenome]